MNPGSLKQEEFLHALSDYYFLMNQGYPEKGSLKLVGDRYRLDSGLRTLLYRGVTSQEKAVKRSRRLIDTCRDSLVIDGYNVLFTLLNYRLGRLVFISADNICRDNGSLFGKIRNENLFEACAAMLMDYLKDSCFPEIILYLDEPVSFSKKHERMLSLDFKKYDIKGRVERAHSADQALLMHASGTLATSDSNVLDHTENPVFDLPRKILESKFNALLYNLHDFLVRNQGISG